MEEATILIIDDEQSYLDTISKILQPKNYNILQAINGKMGCIVAEKFLPDIIIVDWEMPELNGIDTIKYLKSKPETQDIPIIMSTGIMTAVENLETALNAGAVDFLRKPIDAIELTARLNSMLKLARSYKENLIQRKKLAELNVTKDKFFSIIAHDLKGPLGGIISLLELLQSRKDFNEEYKKLINLLAETSKVTFKLLENLLTWARLQRGELVYKPKKYPVFGFISENFTQLKSTAEAKNIVLANKVPAECNAYFDADMLNTILRNLINNAIKYSYEGGEITVSAETVNNMVAVRVKDSGVGIDNEQIKNMFRIDVKQFSTEGTKGEIGSGLGLILCKEFIIKMAGNIYVESRVGQGAEFIFTLPVESMATVEN